MNLFLFLSWISLILSRFKNDSLTHKIADVQQDMSDSGKRIFTTAGISTSLDTVLATTLGSAYHSRLKKSNANLLSEKSLSNNSSKSSSGSSLTLTNNQNIQNQQNNSANCTTNNQFPHHQFYCSQLSHISTSANWNNNNNSTGGGGRNSICSQKVSKIVIKKYILQVRLIFQWINCRSQSTTVIS